MFACILVKPQIFQFAPPKLQIKFSDGKKTKRTIEVNQFCNLKMRVDITLNLNTYRTYQPCSKGALIQTQTFN